MKYFAITPDTCTPESLVQHLARLHQGGVSFLYLRSPMLYNSLNNLAQAVNAAGIMPLVSYRFADQVHGLPHGLHYKSSEHNALPSVHPNKGVLITASCHSAETALQLLQGSVDYVFVSPVFSPIAKPGDTRRTIPRARLAELACRFGERVVLLGGMTVERIEQLHHDLRCDFSVAGISMFFGTDNATTR